MRPILAVTGSIVIVLSVIVGISTLNQANQEQLALASRLQSRTQVVADSLADTITPPYRSYATTTVEGIIKRITDEQRVDSIGVFDNFGAPVSVSSGLPTDPLLSPIIARAMDSNAAVGQFAAVSGQSDFVYAEPLHGSDSDTVIGALVVVQSAAYIDDSTRSIWIDSILRLLLQIVVFGGGIFFLVRWVFLRPLEQLAESMQSALRGEAVQGARGQDSFQPMLGEISKMRTSLTQARLAASEEARLRLEKLDTPWTEERLKEFAKDMLKDRAIVAVSHLESYIHTKEGGDIAVHVPASGLITAVEPVMRSCGGLWIAWGSGDADKLTVDAHDRIAVPPEEPKYTLKRVWLSEEDVKNYSEGFCDQAMFPLCHMTHTRPIFREEDWAAYKRVNEKFARAILAEIKDIKKPLIFIQDFQFTLAPRIIKKARPDAAIGIFWHIPWVSAEAFSICPWKKEIVDGMLGADLLGFHTQLHCNNFIETVARELEARIDYEQSMVTRGGHATLVKTFPVSVAFPNNRGNRVKNERETPEGKELLASLGISTPYVGIGADRLDYIKGIPERLNALERFFDRHPDYRERFTFVQISVPSGTEDKKYREFFETIKQEVERINDRFKTKTWKPIVFLPRRHSHEELTRYYRMADLCLITSLHDGMNLVAKEYVAARDDERGALVLSQFAGASKELKDALIVNPYDAQETAEAIFTALTMSPTEQRDRMRKMRDVVKNYTIYRWSAEFIKTLAQLD